MSRRRALVWAIALVVTLGSCEGSGGDGLGGPNEVTLTVETPTFVDFSTLAAVDYVIMAPGGATTTGRLDRAGVGRISPDDDRTLIWRGAVDLATEVFVLEFTGRDETGNVLCTGDREVSISGLLRTEVYERLLCEGPQVDPVGSAIVTLQAPATDTFGETRLFFTDIVCGDDDSLVVDEWPLSLSSEQVADFGAGPTETRVWAAEFEGIPAGRCRATVTEEFEPRVEACRASLDFSVVRDQVTPVTFVLPCMR